MALGTFFGQMLPPRARISLAAGAAVVLRAKLAAAAASTLVIKPVDFAPAQLVAWKLGQPMPGNVAAQDLPPLPATPALDTPAAAACSCYFRPAQLA